MSKNGEGPLDSTSFDKARSYPSGGRTGGRPAKGAGSPLRFDKARPYMAGVPFD